MGFQPDMFTVLFAIPRAAGWLAQWNELMTDSDQKISRPRQIYLGHEHRKVEMHSKAADAIAVHKPTLVAK